MSHLYLDSVTFWTIQIGTRHRLYSFLKTVILLNKNPNSQKDKWVKVGCVWPMVVVSILPQAEFGWNDHRKDAPHCRTTPKRPKLEKKLKNMFQEGNGAMYDEYVNSYIHWYIIIFNIFMYTKINLPLRNLSDFLYNYESVRI